MSAIADEFQTRDPAGEIMACLLAVGVCNLRPTVIGETQSLPVCLALVAVEAFFILHVSHIGAAFRYRRGSLAQLVLHGTLVVYVMGRNAFDVTMSEADTLKGFAISAAFFVALAIVLSNGRYGQVFFDAFAIAVVASCASIIVSLAFVAAGVPASSLVIGAPPTPRTYVGMEGVFVFPFSFTNNDAPSWFGVIPRFAGLFREVGCLPPFACWAAVYGFLRGWSVLWSAVCLLAAVLCLSTIGPIAFFTAAMLALYKMKVPPKQAIALTLGAGVLLWPVLYSMQFIGLEDKLNYRAGSYEDREALTWAVLDTKNIIFGDGAGWSEVSSKAGINLVSQIRVYGVIYFAIVVAIYALPIRNFRFWVAACVPAIVTVLLSQPIAIEPAFLMIFFSGPFAGREASGSGRERRRPALLRSASLAGVPAPIYAGLADLPAERVGGRALGPGVLAGAAEHDKVGQAARSDELNEGGRPTT